MLNLDDFSALFISSFNNEATQNEDIEKFYQKKLEEMKNYYENRLKEEREKAFKQGYEAGKKEAENYFQNVLSNEKKKYEQKIKRDIEVLKQEFKQLSFALREENVRLGKKIVETVSQSLEEIFEFLFIQDENLPYLKEKLKELIEDFKLESKPISIEVSQKFAGILSDIEGISVKVNKDIDDGDFVVRFTDFTIVHSIKEKLSILREEIEREIKKYSQI